PYVTPRALHAIKASGAVAINVYPDVSVMAHGSYLPRTLPLYDWVFTTKSFGLVDMRGQLGITNASFFPPAYDPEIHRLVELNEDDARIYGTDLGFIGTYQPKTERLIAAVNEANLGITIKIWGNQWEKSHETGLRKAIQGSAITGVEYAKCIRATRINL